MSARQPFNVERTVQGWECYCLVDGYLQHRYYIGYTKREAAAEFRVYLHELGVEVGQ